MLYSFRQSTNDKETFVCIASGPSLSEDQINYVKANHDKCNIIVVNDNYQRVPNADFLFASDHSWWLHHYDRVIQTVKPYCEFHTIRGTTDKFYREGGDDTTHPITEHRIHKQRRKIGRDHLIFHGGNSGIMAIDFARLRGATKIILIGFDHQHTNGKSHWFGDHPPNLRNQDIPSDWFKQFTCLAEAYDELGIDLVNCSYPTALTDCRQSSIEREL